MNTPFIIDEKKVPHILPVGSLVEVYRPKATHHGCRLFIVGRAGHDETGQPLYDLSFDPLAREKFEEADFNAFNESKEMVVSLSAEIKAKWHFANGSILRNVPEANLTHITPLWEV